MVTDDGGSLYSSKLFAFDDEVVNSLVYRQVLARHMPGRIPQQTPMTRITRLGPEMKQLHLSMLR
ncbi:uncharacterized protein BDV17DRAFT_213524 [Aspergillus undulatus]|uniref:uncharacterized protein n=1 Tax=Aspergillus undulatus TaxID=1810928 RepID=UPI003CCCB7BA